MKSTTLIVRNLASLTFARITIMGINLITFAYLGRILGVANFGIIGFSNAFVSYFIVIIDLGFVTYGAREIARDHSRTKILVDAILSLRLTLAVVSFLILLLIVAFIDQPALVKIVIVIQSGQFFIGALMPAFAFQGQERMSIIAIQQVAAPVLLLLSSLLLVHGPEDVVMAAILSVATLAVSGFWMLAVYMKTHGVVNFHFSFKNWKTIVVGSVAFGAASAIVALYLNVDSLIIGFERPTEDMGLYYAARRLFTVATIPAALIVSVFIPPIARTLGDVKEMNIQAEYCARTMAFIGAPIAVLAAGFSMEIIDIIYGRQYLAASPTLSILMVDVILVYFSNYLACCLWAWNKQGAALVPLAIAAATNIICNLFAIPRFGVEGAATILLVTEIIVAAGLCGIQYGLIRHLHIALFGKFLLCAVMALGVGKASIVLLENYGHEWPALVNLIVASAISGAVYLSLIHVFHLADIKRLWRLVARVQTSQSATEV